MQAQTLETIKMVAVAISHVCAVYMLFNQNKKDKK